MTVLSQELSSPRLSMHTQSIEESHRHKWIESEKHGRDLGESAIQDWYRKHWKMYCRNMRIEHVFGRQSLEEFNDGPSSHILELLQADDLLLQLILDRISTGWENLDVIVWAGKWGLPMERIHNILYEMNINCARLDPDIGSENLGD